MYERFTDKARAVMQTANQEAQKWNHEYVGTEHILLGLCKCKKNIEAFAILDKLDVSCKTIVTEIERLIQRGPEMVTMGKLPQTPRAKKVIEYSMEEARDLNCNYVGTEHLLLGLVREQEGVAAQILLNLGVKLEAVRQEVKIMMGVALPNQQLLEELSEDVKTLLQDNKELIHEAAKWAERYNQLANGIRVHRDQRGDDRCWQDDETLYKLLPEGYTPPARDTSVEMSLCEKYIKNRLNPNTEYVSPQRRIEELEQQIQKVINQLSQLLLQGSPNAGG